MNILCCTEGSERSRAAFKNASKFIKNAQIGIICVIDWNFLPLSMNLDASNYSEMYDNIADSVLNYAEKLVLNCNFTVNKKIKAIGSATEGILDVLKDEKYDLIILGSQGKKGISQWLGSVSKRIIENSHTPCFVSKKETGNKKIVFTTDGSSTSDDAAKKFADIFDVKDKHITILSVKENPEFYPIDATFDKNWLDAIEKQQKILAVKAINKIKMLFDIHGIQINNEVILTGNPAQEIINYCEKEETDLVVMGAREKKDISKFLLGSISRRVLDNITCGVLIIGK